MSYWKQTNCKYISFRVTDARTRSWFGFQTERATELTRPTTLQSTQSVLATELTRPTTPAVHPERASHWAHTRDSPAVHPDRATLSSHAREPQSVRIQITAAVMRIEPVPPECIGPTFYRSVYYFVTSYTIFFHQMKRWPGNTQFTIEIQYSSFVTLLFVLKN